VEVISDHDATLRWLGIDQVPLAVVQAGQEPGTAVYRRYTKSPPSSSSSVGAVLAAGAAGNMTHADSMHMIQELSKSLDGLSAMMNSTNATVIKYMFAGCIQWTYVFSLQICNLQLP
jgi:hypothetical protein